MTELITAEAEGSRRLGVIPSESAVVADNFFVGPATVQ